MYDIAPDLISFWSVGMYVGMCLCLNFTEKTDKKYNEK